MLSFSSFHVLLVILPNDYSQLSRVPPTSSIHQLFSLVICCCSYTCSFHISMFPFTPTIPTFFILSCLHLCINTSSSISVLYLILAYHSYHPLKYNSCAQVFILAWEVLPHPSMFSFCIFFLSFYIFLSSFCMFLTVQ